MNEKDLTMSMNGERELVGELIQAQLAHFRDATPPCRGVELPDGVLLRHTQSSALYFYLKTVVENGTFRTHVFASDSPYDRQKASIGMVSTPMFERGAEFVHLEKVKVLLLGWVEFVKHDPSADADKDFHQFNLDNP